MGAARATRARQLARLRSCSVAHRTRRCRAKLLTRWCRAQRAAGERRWRRTRCWVCVLVVLSWLGAMLIVSDPSISLLPSYKNGALCTASLPQRCFQNSESWTLYMLYCLDMAARGAAAGRVSCVTWRDGGR